MYDATSESTAESTSEAPTVHRGEPARHMVDTTEPMVLFLVGARLNRLTWPGRVLRIGRAMSAMQQELSDHPELGCLHIENWGGRTSISVQYWRSREELMRYARSADSEHLPAWRHFNRMLASDPALGIWHEIHEVSSAHALYVNMTPLGLGRADLAPTGAEPSPAGMAG